MSHRSTARSSLTRRSVVASLVGVAVAGCLSTPDDAESDGNDGEGTADPAHPTPTDGPPTAAQVQETTVVKDLEVPWDLAIAGDVAYVTEREVGVRRLATETLLTGQALTPDETELIVEPSDVPDFENREFGGFLGIAAHPGYPDPPALYLYHSADGDGLHNRVVRYDVERDEVTTVVDGIPGDDGHLGGRLTFGPDNHLWITTGDAGQPELAQDPGSLGGAVLRVTADGDAAPGNQAPADGDPRTITYGHRNPQGIAFAPDGEVFLTDHGPSGRDEVLVVQPGANYGWPTARGGPDDPEYDAYSDHDAFTPPVLNTGPETTWAPSGATFYTDDAIEAWQDRLLVAGLISETLYAVTLVPSGSDRDPSLGDNGVRFDAPWLDDRYTATAHPLFAGEYGRLRHVEQGPDGSVFLLTSNRDGWADDPFPKAGDDRILRIDPA